MRVREIVDLSHSIGPRTQVYPGDPRPTLTPVATVPSDGCNVTHVSMGSQSGTHVDAPYHFHTDGARIDDLALELFVGPAVLIDVTGHTDRRPITRADIAPWERKLTAGTIALLHTGWSRYYGSERYFSHPYLDGPAAEYLLALGVTTIGVDAPNLDETPDADHPGAGWPVHHTVLGRGGVLIENLRGLADIDFADPIVSVLPIPLAGVDGAPVRAVAMRLG